MDDNGEDEVMAEALAEASYLSSKDKRTAVRFYINKYKGGVMTSDWQKVEMESGDVWDFQNDKEIEGVLISKEENVGPNESWMYRIQKADGTELGVWGNTVLDGRLKKIEVGEEIRLVYLGKLKSPKTNREYHSFDVFHRAAPMKKVE